MATLLNKNSSTLKSVHGKSLLRELSDRQANLDKVIEILNKEPHAGRLKDPETGFNSYHYLLNGDFSSNFVKTVLKTLIEKCPKGAEDLSLNGQLPLHIALRQRKVIEAAVLMLVEGFISN
jgi:hypothetical protein